jgi:hypothetical protein
MQKVKWFGEKFSIDLELKINEFAKTHKIIQISYARDKYHSCMVLYEE